MSASTLETVDGPWVERWLSAERLTTYLAATASRCDALALYEWNTELSAALFRDLCAVEIALRNAYDHAIDAAWAGPGHWTDHAETLFPPTIRTRNGSHVDINRKSRNLLEEARSKAGAGSAPAGKTIAELSFGFWRYLSTRGQEKNLWLPYLHRAFPQGTDRSKHVDARVRSLHHLRNRVAHHEPLFRLNVHGSHRHLTELASLLDPALGSYIVTQSTVPRLLATRPSSSKP